MTNIYHVSSSLILSFHLSPHLSFHLLINLLEIVREYWQHATFFIQFDPENRDLSPLSKGDEGGSARYIVKTHLFSD